MPRFAPLIGLAALAALGSARADDPAPRARVHFDRVVIDDDFPDAYQVEVADVDGDRKPDLVTLGGKTIAWYQNPTWTRRVIATGGDPLKADIISSATVDLDGDGRAEVAIACDFAMNTPTRGQLFLATQGAALDQPWSFRKVADVPSIHRVRWNDFLGDGKPELVVAPIFGPGAAPPTYDQDPARVVVYRPDPGRPKAGAWQSSEVMRRPVVHAVGVIPAAADRQQAGSLFTSDGTGLSRATIIPGEEADLSGWETAAANPVRGAVGPPPKRGCSDSRRGVIGRRGPFVATIEPWHGSELAIWAPGGAQPGPPGRTVIDATLDDGHALWTADVDGDGTDEIFAGHRGKDHRVAMYRLEGDAWVRTVIDRAIAAQDLRGGDLDGDGVPDIVAVGGSTHNVVWYRPTRLKEGPAPAR